MSDKLYTWIDVQNRLREFQNSMEGKTWFIGKSTRAYWDGLHISLLTGQEKINKKSIQSQLEQIFLARYNSITNAITLGEAPNTIEFPVFFEEEDNEEDILKEYFKAGFSPLSFVADISDYQGDRTRKNEEPIVLAFHSFKGGVGRTLHAITLATHLSKTGKKVLLIDADFEAPGISWYFSNSVISFADFIAMAHGDTDLEFNYTLKNSSALIPQNSTLDNIYILPAFRDANQFGTPIIKPEHLNTSDRPFQLQDLVIELGKRLSVDYIIVDLRAGLSELSCGWLLDPKIYKVIVTTLSGQSLRGCQNLLEQTSAKYEKFKFKNRDNMLPFLVFSQIPTETERDVQVAWEVTDETYHNEDFNNLKDYYISLLDIPQENSPFAEWKDEACFSIEYSNLKNLPHSWGEVIDRIEKSGLIEGIEPLEKWIPVPSKSNIFSADVSLNEAQLGLPQDEKRELLSKTAEGLITADRTIANDFLVTQPIEQLAARHISSLPIVVVVGAKGSGKTYLFKSLGRFDDWNEFVKKVRPNLNGEVISAKFCRITTPEDISSDEMGQNRALIKEEIENMLKKPLATVSDWRKKWLDIIAWANGVQIGEIGAWDVFENQNKGNVVCLFDGLEDLFPEYFSKETHKSALRALLQDVPNWLESLPKKNIGLIVFIRQDIVSYVIPQNVAQFLSRHREFQLKWNKEEALRLVYWVASIKADVIPNDTRPVRNLSKSDLEKLLYPVWGQKLGGNNSREARTADWVLDALSNFQNEVQSRDIVRFLYDASSISKDSGYDDRLLTPTGIRSSIAKVGVAKLTEVKDENKPLYEILQKISGQSSTLSFPCAKAKLDFLSSSEQEMLEKNGILRPHNNEYYLAEIYRRGLGVNYSKRGKPRLL